MSTKSEPCPSTMTTSSQQQRPQPKPAPKPSIPLKALPPVKRYPEPPPVEPPKPKGSQGATYPTVTIPKRRYSVHSVSSAGVQAQKPSSPECPATFFQNTKTLFGLGEREYAFGIVPRGYGMTILAITGCYSLLRWEKNRIKKSKKKPPFTSTNAWFTKLKTIEKVYGQARNDFPRTVMLTLIGGLGMPYAAAVGALFWCAGRAVDFHEAEEKPGVGTENTEAVLCRFGKFLMICGICKLAFDFTRGRISCAINE